jgi:hypothetical protein
MQAETGNASSAVGRGAGEFKAVSFRCRRTFAEQTEKASVATSDIQNPRPSRKPGEQPTRTPTGGGFPEALDRTGELGAAGSIVLGAIGGRELRFGGPGVEKFGSAGGAAAAGKGLAVFVARCR